MKRRFKRLQQVAPTPVVDESFPSMSDEESNKVHESAKDLKSKPLSEGSTGLFCKTCYCYSSTSGPCQSCYKQTCQKVALCYWCNVCEIWKDKTNWRRHKRSTLHQNNILTKIMQNKHGLVVSKNLMCRNINYFPNPKYVFCVINTTLQSDHAKGFESWAEEVAFDIEYQYFNGTKFVDFINCFVELEQWLVDVHGNRETLPCIIIVNGHGSKPNFVIMDEEKDLLQPS